VHVKRFTAPLLAVVVPLAFPSASSAAYPSEGAEALAEFSVKVVAHHGGFLNLGDTEITISAPAGWRQKVTVTAHGRTVRPREPNAEKYEFAIVTFPWTCKHYGLVYKYLVTAQSPSGQTLTQTGHYKGASRWWCQHGWRRASAFEIRKLDKQSEDETRQQEAKERRAREQVQREVERFDRNCRALGGKVVTIEVGEHGAVVPVCRGPDGGIVPVPT
jgi:hypothetical protein